MHKISSARVLCFILMKDRGIEENTGGLMYIYWIRPPCSTSRWPTLSQRSNVYNNKIIYQCQLRRAEQSLHFASIPNNFSIFIILRPRPRTYASTSPLLLLQLHQQQQLLSIINIIIPTNHLQHAKLWILPQHLTSHAAYERNGWPPKRPAAKHPCIYIYGCSCQVKIVRGTRILIMLKGM